MVVAIPPKIAVAKFVGQIKAAASTKFNKSGISEVSFFWQEEYGAFSIDGKRFPNYIAYAEGQKEHHAHGTTIPILERMDEIAVPLMRESTMSYIIEEEGWRHELEMLAIEPGSPGVMM